jgi:hypothetical protein
MTIAKLILTIMSTLLFMSFADAADQPEWSAVTAAYSNAHAKGDSQAIEDALDLATKYVEKHPGDGRGLTYRGSLAAMKARESYLPWRKLSSLNQGVDWMDEGVSAVLNNKELAGTRTEIEVRMVRGTTSARIPKLFGRGSVARADFLAVVSNPHFNAVSNINKASVYAWLAVLSNRQNDSPGTNDWLNKARAADATTANSIWEHFK